jgi:hypothetical protein
MELILNVSKTVIQNGVCRFESYEGTFNLSTKNVGGKNGII